MDIELAVKKSLSALTLSEKSLADRLLYSKQIFTGTTAVAQVWLRAPVYVLSDALQTARSMASEKMAKLRVLRVFCDTLVINNGDIIRPDPTDTKPGYLTIHLYARRIQAPVGGNEPSLTFRMTRQSSLSLWTPNIPSTFEVDISLGSGTLARYKPQVSPGNFGVTYEFEEDVQQLDPIQESSSTGALDYVNYLSLINEDGTVQDQGYKNDDLPRLLQFQTLLAQACADNNRQLALDLLEYVVAATAQTSSIWLNYQATALRNSLSLESSVSAVSSVNVYSSKQVLKSRLSAALAFEKAFQDFLLEARNANYQVSTSLNLLAKSNDALDTYRFLVSVRQREYDTAISANQKAESLFNTNQSEVATKAKAFEAGIEKYKKEEEAKANKEIIKGILSLAVAVVATVATAGAGAPAIAGAGASLANAAAKTASLWAKLKKIYDQLKKVYEKIKPMLEKLKEIVELSKKLVKSLENLQRVGDDLKGVVGHQPGKLNGEASDIGLAEWEKFNLAVGDMQQDLSTYEIEGKREYFFTLKTLVIHGSLFIKTQSAVVQKGDDLAIVKLQQKMEGKDNGRLSALSYRISADERVLDLLKRAMFDRVMAIRTLVYHDFYTYHSAYMYHSLSERPLLRLSPVKPVVDYLDDAAKLQGAVVAYGSRVLIQSRQFELTSLCGYASSDELQANLGRTGSVRLTVDPQDPIWQGFSRIRMTGARCYLDGARPASDDGASEVIRLELKTDGRFFDRNILSKDADKQLIPVNAFLGDPRTLLFEYNLKTKQVICDGRWGEKDDYTKHTPITNWDISIVGHNNPATAQVDLSSLQSVKIVFTCDAVWTG